MRLSVRRCVVVLAIGLAGALTVSGPSFARGGGGESERGSCSGGPGEWRLSVDRRDSGRLRVRFRIDDVPARQSWHVFLSDNGERVFSGTRRADEHGDLRVTKLTANRAGSDRVAASAVNSATGVTCSGSLTF